MSPFPDSGSRSRSLDRGAQFPVAAPDQWMAGNSRAFGLTPHRADTFQPSQDPEFVEKVRDVVGRYSDPPDNARVVSAAKTQVPAPNRHGLRNVNWCTA